MFFRILKRDLRRKRTMNIIILLFVILATMFVASSVNNILTVVNGLDYYFDKAGLDHDYFILFRLGDGTATLDDVLTAEPSVTNYYTEPLIMVSNSNFATKEEKALDFTNTGFILSLENAQLNYFTGDNNVITEVNEGEVYITGLLMENSGV